MVTTRTGAVSGVLTEPPPNENTNVLTMAVASELADIDLFQVRSVRRTDGGLVSITISGRPSGAAERGPTLDDLPEE